MSDVNENKFAKVKLIKHFIKDLNQIFVSNGSIISSQPCMTSLHFSYLSSLNKLHEGRV